MGELLDMVEESQKRIREREKRKMNEKIKQIVAENLGVGPKSVTPEAALLDDLGADSLDIIELVLYVEEEFGVEIPDEVSDGILTVKDLIEAVEVAT